MSESRIKCSNRNKTDTILKLLSSKRFKSKTLQVASPTLSDFKMKRERFKEITSSEWMSLGVKLIASLSSKSVLCKIRSTGNFKKWNAPRSAVTNNSFSN
jgi:uncharacterized protein with ParB-like and HNH nuclease domain